MTKRINQRYSLLRRYKYDVFGRIAVQGFRKKWLEKSQKYKVYFRNVKIIQRRIKERLSEKVQRKKRKKLLYKIKGKGGKKSLKGFMGTKQLYHRNFFYRVDIIKLSPRRKKKTLFGKLLRRRHKLRLFGSQMGVRQFRSYLKKSSKSSRMLKKFIELFESRLDIFLYRLNWVWNSLKGRQDINHKNFTINGRVSIFPSQHIKLFDMVSVVNYQWFYRFFKERVRRSLALIKKKLSKNSVNFLLSKKRKYYNSPRIMNKKKKFVLGEIFYSTPSYIEVNLRTFTAMFVYNPSPDEIFFPFKVKKSKLPGISKRFKS